MLNKYINNLLIRLLQKKTCMLIKKTKKTKTLTKLLLTLKLVTLCKINPTTIWMRLNSDINYNVQLLCGSKKKSINLKTLALSKSRIIIETHNGYFTNPVSYTTKNIIHKTTKYDGGYTLIKIF